MEPTNPPINRPLLWSFPEESELELLKLVATVTREVYVRSPVVIVVETVASEDEEAEPVTLAFDIVEGEFVDLSSDSMDVDSGVDEVMLLVWALLEDFSAPDTALNSSRYMGLEEDADPEVIFDEGSDDDLNDRAE